VGGAGGGIEGKGKGFGVQMWGKDSQKPIGLRGQDGGEGGGQKCKKGWKGGVRALFGG